MCGTMAMHGPLLMQREAETNAANKEKSLCHQIIIQLLILDYRVSSGSTPVQEKDVVRQDVWFRSMCP